MPRRKLSYQEGDWFAVPLLEDGYGLGRAARLDGRGIVLGYFFGPRRAVLPSLQETPQYQAQDAVLVCQFSDIGLIEGKWPILGQVGLWGRAEWPLPLFSRIALDRSTAWAVEYTDANINSVVREFPISIETARRLPNDALLGNVALQIRLDRLLSTTA